LRGRFARIAYETHRLRLTAADYFPTWEKLNPNEQENWIAVASAVLTAGAAILVAAAEEEAATPQPAAGVCR
jgi:hypothetical protein